MRTARTLDCDVAAMLERLASPPRRREPFRTSAVSLGGCRIGSIDNVAELLAVAEGDSFR